jgi:hypothetical protein
MHDLPGHGSCESRAIAQAPLYHGWPQFAAPAAALFREFGTVPRRCRLRAARARCRSADTRPPERSDLETGARILQRSNMDTCFQEVIMTMWRMTCGALAAGLLMFAAATASAQGVFPATTLDNETVISGFVGSSFGDDLDDPEVDFGGTLAWLWRGAVGAEFLAGFAPNTTLSTGVSEAQINNYMANAIAAAPLGENGRIQPFVSGGVGAIALRVDDDEFDLDAPDETEFGMNVGFGLMSFADRWGVRGDVRYFREVGGDVSVAAPGTATLEDLDYWRGNVGIAYRW